MSDSVYIEAIGQRELPELVKIHMAAFAESALAKLGPAAVRRYYEWQFTGLHELTALGAFIGNTMVGFCFAGVFRGAMSGFLRKNRAFLIRRVISHPWLVLNPVFRDRIGKGLRGLTAFKAPPASSVGPGIQGARRFGILAIAVEPLHQAHGIGRQLMEIAEGIAIEHGFQEMGLTVQPQNHQGVSFYEDLGWQKVARNGVWSGEMRKAIVPVSIGVGKSAVSRASTAP